MKGEHDGRDSLCYDGILKSVPADEALEGQILFVTAHLIILIIWVKKKKSENNAEVSKWL